MASSISVTVMLTVSTVVLLLFVWTLWNLQSYLNLMKELSDDYRAHINDPDIHHRRFAALDKECDVVKCKLKLLENTMNQVCTVSDVQLEKDA